jgi:CRISPR-associated protein Cas2
MYFILVYDIAGEDRLPKVLKTCRKYLNWVQNSVFEGELTESQFQKLTGELKDKTDLKEDSLIFYSVREKRWLDKEVMGIEKNVNDNFL